MLFLFQQKMRNLFFFKKNDYRFIKDTTYYLTFTQQYSSQANQRDYFHLKAYVGIHHTLMISCHPLNTLSNQAHQEISLKKGLSDIARYLCDTKSPKNTGFLRFSCVCKLDY